MSDLTDPRYLLELAALTVRSPREGAAEVLRVAPDRSALWLAFSLMVVASLMMGEVVSMLVPPVEAGPLMDQSPIVLGLLQGALLFVTVFAITYFGRLCGGTGAFDGALALVTWLQFVLLLVQLVQLGLLLVAPLVAAMISILAVGLFFWLLVNFIAVLHDFASTGMVFVMTIVCFLGILFALSLILTILGLSPELVFIEA